MLISTIKQTNNHSITMSGRDLSSIMTPLYQPEVPLLNTDSNEPL